VSVSIDGYLIDVFISEQPVKSGQVTRYPIEDGASIADHVIEAPERLTVTGIVSNNPIGQLYSKRFEIAQGATGVLPSNEAYARLAKIKKEYKLVTVIGSSRTFDNMLLVSLTDPRSASTGDALEFTATFEQITTVNIQTKDKFTQVKLPRHKENRNKGAKPAKQVAPAVQPKAVTSAKSSRGSSMAVKLARLAL